MIINKPYLCTKVEIWNPKYNTDSDDWEVWLSVRKMNYASSVVIIEFTKAKHLMGQRFCVRRQDVEHCEQGTNGKIPIFKVPFSKLESYETTSEIRNIALSLFD